jgi:hypothetical protein
MTSLVINYLGVNFRFTTEDIQSRAISRSGNMQTEAAMPTNTRLST